MDSSAICQKECQTTLASLKCWTWPINNVLAHLDQNKSLQSSGLSLLLTHKLHTKTVPELKALGSRVLNTCPRIPGPSWFCLLWLSLYWRKVWLSSLSQGNHLGCFTFSITVLLHPLTAERKFEQVVEGFGSKSEWKDHLSLHVKRPPCLLVKVVSLHGTINCITTLACVAQALSTGDSEKGCQVINGH